MLLLSGHLDTCCVTSLPLINLHPWPHGIVKWPLNVHFRTTADIAGDPGILSYSFQILWKNNFIQQFFSSVSVFIFSSSHEHASMSDTKEKKLLKKVFIFVFFVHKNILVALENYGWTTDVTWNILTMSLKPFCVLTVVIPLLSMEGQKALGFHPNCLNLCSEDERRSYGFGTTWGWVIKYTPDIAGVYL